MAEVPWKIRFWERIRESFSFAGDAGSCLAAVADDLAYPLRGCEEDRALVRIRECEHILAEASSLVAFAISALSMVDIMAVRCMRSDDADEVRAQFGARAAKEQAWDAYDNVASSRGHLGAARRLLAATKVGCHYNAVEDERVAALAAIKAATTILVEAFRWSEDGVPDVALPRADSPKRSAAVGVAPKLVGAEDATRSDDEWYSVGGFVPGALRRVALCGGVPEMEAAQATLRVCADAVSKGLNVTAALEHPAAADWASCYNSASLQAFQAAHAELSGLLALNVEAGIVFLRFAPQIGPDRVGNGWRSSDTWNASVADVERHGRAALDLLLSASALVDYCFAGVLVWGSSSSSWNEARETMRRALTDAGEARDAGERLRHAAAREFFHVWAVVDPAASWSVDSWLQVSGACVCRKYSSLLS